MRIRLTSLYQNTSGVRIAAGDYDLDDPILCGLGGYLVQTQHATRLLVVEAAGEPDPPDDPVDGEKALSEMTKAELAELADERGIAIGNPKNITKDEIIALLMGESEGGEA